VVRFEEEVPKLDWPKVDLPVDVPQLDIDLPDLIPEVDIPGMFEEVTDPLGEVAGGIADVGGSIGGGIEGFTETVAELWAGIFGTGAETVTTLGEQAKDIFAPITGGLGGLLGSPMLLLVVGGAILLIIMVMG